MIKKIFKSLEVPPDTKEMLDRVDSNAFVDFRKVVGKVRPDKEVSSTGLTQSAVSSSLTCTSSRIQTKNDLKLKTEDEIRGEYLTLIKSRQETAEIVVIFQDLGNLHFTL